MHTTHPDEEHGFDSLDKASAKCMNVNARQLLNCVCVWDPDYECGSAVKGYDPLGDLNAIWNMSKGGDLYKTQSLCENSKQKKQRRLETELRLHWNIWN